MVEEESPERVREYCREFGQSEEVIYSFSLTFLSACPSLHIVTKDKILQNIAES